MKTLGPVESMQATYSSTGKVFRLLFNKYPLPFPLCAEWTFLYFWYWTWPYNLLGLWIFTDTIWTEVLNGLHGFRLPLASWSSAVRKHAPDGCCLFAEATYWDTQGRTPAWGSWWSWEYQDTWHKPKFNLQPAAQNPAKPPAHRPVSKRFSYCCFVPLSWGYFVAMD